ncbi:divalent-cation tolerance protein CutA [Planktothrix mougeotii]|uniref:Divalent-cation tolerance protein CutA n=1 Tax=Planktothrix mougeotii LEGE 06226 TaxID=1828728 RepID=A0ABR9U5U5_9CYAN|nr:divalent-cation tolerance protein CutA [Planktothrix mougeotii]MBE9141817.1 divalent-cation tolerance protein CutA [Planktothrix mougeotii LEGE 06226]
MGTDYAVVLVTASSRLEAEKIAQALVEKKLAACVSLMPIHSIYTWKSEVCQEDEWQLIIKTDIRQFEQLETQIKQLHSYEVPEIIALPIIKGSADYLNWISEQTQKY